MISKDLDFQFFLISTRYCLAQQICRGLSVLPYFDYKRVEYFVLVPTFSSSLFRPVCLYFHPIPPGFQFFLISTGGRSFHAETAALSVLPYFDYLHLYHYQSLNLFQFFLISTSRNSRSKWLCTFQFFLISTQIVYTYSSTGVTFQFFLISTSFLSPFLSLENLSVLPYFDEGIKLDENELKYFQFFLISTSMRWGLRYWLWLSVLPYFDKMSRSRKGWEYHFQFFLISTLVNRSIIYMIKTFSSSLFRLCLVPTSLLSFILHYSLLIV